MQFKLRFLNLRFWIDITCLTSNKNSHFSNHWIVHFVVLKILKVVYPFHFPLLGFQICLHVIPDSPYFNLIEYNKA